MRKQVVLVGLMLLLAGSIAGGVEAQPTEIPAPHFYLAPTVGFWRWDGESTVAGDPGDRMRAVYGGRLGYAPLEALSAELVFLTGSNRLGGDVELDEGVSDDLRLTQVELSFLVNFRSLAVSRLYPFVNLGGGVALRSSDAAINGEHLYDGSHLAFHLGGGVKADLGRLASLRLHVRDTFFTETRGAQGQETQVTVDAVEFSLAFEYRIPFQNKGRPARLR